MTESVFPTCSIGEINKQACHKTTQCSSKGIYSYNELNEVEQQLLAIRSDTDVELLKTVCYHHHALLLIKYESYQKKCCNPTKSHKKAIYAHLQKPLSKEEAATLKRTTGENIKPGQKLCSNCYKLFQGQLPSPYPGSFIQSPCTLSQKSSTSDRSFEFSGSVQDQVEVENINETLINLNTSPLTRHSLQALQRPAYAKRKVEEVATGLKTKLIKLLSIPEEEYKATTSKIDDFDNLIDLLKAKVEQSTRQEKCKLLTLIPLTWSIRKICEEFKVTRYLAKKSRLLKREKGLFPEIERRLGKCLAQDTVDLVKDFYEDDDISRICPGKKDFVSVRIEQNRVHKQKRLILSNIREIYIQFKSKYPEAKVGFSKFCLLRPKWCITVDSSGSHSVCVCEKHQNIKLMAMALPGHPNYKDLMSKFVCDINDRQCMLHRCENCPGREEFANSVQTMFDENEIDLEDKISFKQWIHKDAQTKLQEIVQSASEFVDNLSSSMEKALEHHYIAKAQASYFLRMKEELPENEAIIVLDFAENYSFLVQDAVQGFHWENQQATLHPFAVYHKKDGKLECLSACIISNEMEHTNSTVHCFIKTILQYLKTLFPRLKHIKYFSDGASSQYKNRKNFINLCHHEIDFGITGEWNFFATSHGKSACDGIGGTAKRLVARASLQLPVTEQIVTPQRFFEWANQNIKGIKFFFISKEEVQIHKELLAERFSKASTVVGTRSHHKFVPLNQYEIKMYRMSSDSFCTKVVIARNEKKESISFFDIPVGQYVAAVYDKEWYVALVLATFKEENDYRLKFMVRDPITNLLTWPTKTDECYVPLNNILCLLPEPQCATTSRRYFKIDCECLNQAKHIFDSVM